MKAKRYTIELAEALDKKLEELAEKRGIPKAELLRRALALYAFVDEEEEKDAKLAIVNDQNEVKYKIAMP